MPVLQFGTTTTSNSQIRTNISMTVSPSITELNICGYTCMTKQLQLILNLLNWSDHTYIIMTKPEDACSLWISVQLSQFIDTFWQSKHKMFLGSCNQMLVLFGIQIAYDFILLIGKISNAHYSLYSVPFLVIILKKIAFDSQLLYCSLVLWNV